MVSFGDLEFAGLIGIFFFFFFTLLPLSLELSNSLVDWLGLNSGLFFPLGVVLLFFLGLIDAAFRSHSGANQSSVREHRRYWDFHLFQKKK